MWDVADGDITVGGRDVRDIPFEQLIDTIAYVSQDNYLFDDTIRNNIRMGNPAATDADVAEAAKASGCHDFIMALQDGYETVTEGGGSHLSGGERQRITIASAMLKNAPIIMLDEATANVDSENESELQRAIIELTSRKTIIMIAHRLKTVRHADQILVLEEGKIIQRGNHDRLFNEDGLYRDFINIRVTESYSCYAENPRPGFGFGFWMSGKTFGAGDRIPAPFTTNRARPRSYAVRLGMALQGSKKTPIDDR